MEGGGEWVGVGFGAYYQMIAGIWNETARAPMRTGTMGARKGRTIFLFYLTS